LLVDVVGISWVTYIILLWLKEPTALSWRQWHWRRLHVVVTLHSLVHVLLGMLEVLAAAAATSSIVFIFVSLLLLLLSVLLHARIPLITINQNFY
jgi:hypothetical protein